MPPILLLFLFQSLTGVGANNLETWCNSEPLATFASSGHCYQLYTKEESGNWTDSQKKCAELAPPAYRGRLAIFPTEEVWKAVEPIWKNPIILQFFKSWWIALRMAEPGTNPENESIEIDWRWWDFVDGEVQIHSCVRWDVPRYGTFILDEDQDCLKIIGTSDHWADGECELTERFVPVCEFLPENEDFTENPTQCGCSMKVVDHTDLVFTPPPAPDGPPRTGYQLVKYMTTAVKLNTTVEAMPKPGFGYVDPSPMTSAVCTDQGWLPKLTPPVRFKGCRVEDLVEKLFLLCQALESACDFFPDPTVLHGQWVSVTCPRFPVPVLTPTTVLCSDGKWRKNTCNGHLCSICLPLAE